MAKIDKPISKLEGDQVLKEIYNETEESIAVSSFIDSKIGNKIVKANPDSVTETYSYYDGLVLLKTIQIVYTSTAKTDIVSVERIA